MAPGYTMVYGVLRRIILRMATVHGGGVCGGVRGAVFESAGGGGEFAGADGTGRRGWGSWWRWWCAGRLGFVIERLAYPPLRKSPKLSSLITAIWGFAVDRVPGADDLDGWGVGVFLGRIRCGISRSWVEHEISHFLSLPYPIFGHGSWLSLGWYQTGLQVIPSERQLVGKDVIVHVYDAGDAGGAVRAGEAHADGQGDVAQ